MKKIIFIHGPNGVGKSTLCRLLHQKLNNSAWLESEWCKMTNPFAYTDDTVEMTVSNMTHMLKSYLGCTSVEYIIFNYGFHGPRRKIYEKVMENISSMEFKLIPILITCSEEENISRMKKDGRDPDRIKRALSVRNIYDGSDVLTLDTTERTVEMAVDKILDLVLEATQNTHSVFRRTMLSISLPSA